ncbi:S8 family serine peptidase [Clostridium sp. FP2]|uniref:S8 family serine peptidase n=1 Tax=Clostridium sp. FP2 TaxID=2724481 RepID=UPI0013E9515F|nr:S8 family serine peptidase [Clostridium sp. FP2]MBZ9623618.1 S8 family serine peptidase [Clostridium sp. FP2]
MNRKKLLSLVLTLSILSSNIYVFNVNAKGVNNGAGYNPTMTSSKDLTNVLNEWQVSKYKGEGMVISIIDSGIDYRHKDMKITDPSKAKIKNKSPQGKGKYFTDKVPYGYNYADKNQNIIDEGSMHGMHVAGIVAANGNSTEVSKFEAIQGVAPEAQLLAMKVFSNDPDYPSCNDEDVVEAIEDSVKLGADVINMSLGSDSGFVENSAPIQKAIKEAEEKGVVVVVSAGNSAYSTSPDKVSDIVDTAVVGAPSTAKEALSVASINNSMLVNPALSYKVGSEYKDIAYSTSEVSPIGILKGEYELVDCSLGTPEDFKGKDLKGKIALVKRGSNTFIEKKVNAQTAGAIATIIYNKDGEKGYISMSTDPNVKIPSIFVTNEDGSKLLASIKTSTKIKFQDKKVSIKNPTAGEMSDFTSWGPTPNLEFKPQVTAPGGDIRSTANNNEYKYMSGTSMASPHTAGIMALILQHMKELKLDKLSPKEKAELAKQLVINTAKPQIDPSSGKDSIPFSPRRQGAGLVDVAAAVKTNVIIVNESDESTAALKQINGLTKQFTLKFKNYGNKEETYTVKTPNLVLSDKSDEAKDIILKGATVSFDKDKVVIPAGAVVELKVTLNIPESTTKGAFVEGFLTFEPSSKDSATLGVPYMGFYGEWNESLIMDKPLWDEGSHLKGTGVYSLTENEDENLLGVVGEDEKSKLPIVDEKLIAVTAANGKVSVTPKIKLLRNAKTMLVNVVDEKGNLVRSLGVEKDLAKDLWKADPANKLQDDNYKEESPWIWDLTSYNPVSGKYEIVKDGQYYFEVKASIDSTTTNYQTMKLPIKVDSTLPTAALTSQSKVNSRKYVLKFKATDKLSGIKDFKIMKNGTYITDKNGSTSMKLAQDADGNYYVNLDLQSGNNNLIIYSTDYAKNTYEYSTKVEVQPLTITSPKASTVFPSGNFELSYSGDSKLVSDMRYFNILVDGEVSAKNIETLSYKFENLSPGKHQITVQAYDIKDTKLEEASTNVIVKNDKLYVNFTGVKREGSFYNSATPTLSGDLSTGVKFFKIQGTDVTINSDLTFKKELNLQDGQNKVSVTAADEKGNKFDYSLNLYCDLLAPKLTIKGIDISGKDKQINVAKNVDTFKINCEVSDNNFGFELFVNGNEISTTADIYAKTAHFETEVKLHAGMNYIEVKAVDRAGNVTSNILSVFR